MILSYSAIYSYGQTKASSVENFTCGYVGEPANEPCTLVLEIFSPRWYHRCDKNVPPMRGHLPLQTLPDRKRQCRGMGKTMTAISIQV
jgi:hypothetical protein